MASDAPDSPQFTRLLDAVVRLDVWETVFDQGQERTRHGVGSGVILDEAGHILTNAHVVNPYAERISVTLANLERVDAKLIGWDHWTDLALVKLDMEEVKARGLRFSAAAFGDSSALKVGEVVYAAGTPNGLTRTLTRGIVSNTHRYFQGTQGDRGYETGDFNTWIQTDAAINPGNSGGPLVTREGEVIGINTRGYLGADNLGFAVPGETARAVMEGLLEHGRITRSYIGIVPAPLQDLEDFFRIEVNRGMLVQGVDPGSPAEQAGLRPGDIVLSLDGDPVDGRFPEQLPGILYRIASLPVGTALTLEVLRGEETLTREVTTEALESRVGEEVAFEDWGLSVQKVSRPIAREMQLKRADGVRIVGVARAYPAEEAGLGQGDIILSVNREPIESLAVLQQAYAAYVEKPEKVLLEVLRNHAVSLRVLKP